MNRWYDEESTEVEEIADRRRPSESSDEGEDDSREDEDEKDKEAFYKAHEVAAIILSGDQR